MDVSGTLEFRGGGGGAFRFPGWETVDVKSLRGEDRWRLRGGMKWLVLLVGIRDGASLRMDVEIAEERHDSDMMRMMERRSYFEYGNVR